MINDITKQIIHESIYELEKQENKQRIEDLFITPIVNRVQKAIYPYIYSILIVFIMILIISIVSFHNLYCLVSSFEHSTITTKFKLD